MQADRDPRTLTAFAVAVVIGGLNFVAVKFSNEELDPLSGAAIRFTAAALLLFLIVAVWRYPLPRGRAAVGAALYGLLGFGVSYAFLYYGIKGLGAGVNSAFVAATPLVTLLLAAAQGQERLTARGLFGGLLAVAGITILSLRVLDADLEIKYVLAALAGVVSIAESGVIVKAFPRAHPMSTNAVGMAAGSIFLIAVAFLFSASWELPTTAKTWGALAYLVLVGSIGLFWLFLYVIARWTASATSYVVTLMPVVAISVSALVADEPLTPELVVGAAVVLAGVYVGALSGRRAPSVPSSEPVPEATPASS